MRKDAAKQRIALVLAAVTSAGAWSAEAADFSVKVPSPTPTGPTPVTDWGGLYAGLNGGWGDIRDRGDPFCLTPNGTLNGIGCSTTHVPNAQVRPTGAFGGGQVGYNVQIGSLIYGLETDFQGANIQDSISIKGPFPQVGGGFSAPGTFTASERLDWFGTARTRLGYSWGKGLVYATGGLMYGGVDVSKNTIFPPRVAYPASLSITKTGWTAGGGVEYGLVGNWSVKAEGLYYDLGHISIAATSGLTHFTSGKNFDVNGVLVRAGINYRFGAPAFVRF